ncbi:hypothetical protein FKW77_010375 [Venturia effusa]|uniref:Uncharacterized protein n=1 Tax=Venturia effusa TaxID=50376 RepID=A0A517L6F1_9PEZI|nr:hypothetical protein FKW77_010375 [Venturia effusa]
MENKSRSRVTKQLFASKIPAGSARSVPAKSLDGINFGEYDPRIPLPPRPNRWLTKQCDLKGSYNMESFTVYKNAHTIEAQKPATRSQAKILSKRKDWVRIGCDDGRVVWWLPASHKTTFEKPWSLLYRPSQEEKHYQEIVGRNGVKRWIYQKSGARSRVLTEMPNILKFSPVWMVHEITKSIWQESMASCPKPPQITQQVIDGTFEEVQKASFSLNRNLSRDAFGILWYGCADKIMAPIAAIENQRARLMYGYSKFGAGTLKSSDILYKWIEASMERCCYPGIYTEQENLIDALFETRAQAETMWPSRLSSTQQKIVETISLAMEKQIDRLENSCEDPAMSLQESEKNMNIVRAFRRVFARRFGPESGTNSAAYTYRPLLITHSRRMSTLQHATTVFSPDEFKSMSDFYLRTDCIASGAVGKIGVEDVSQNSLKTIFPQQSEKVIEVDKNLKRPGSSNLEDARHEETVEADVKPHAGPDLGALILDFEQMALSGPLQGEGVVDSTDESGSESESDSESDSDSDSDSGSEIEPQHVDEELSEIEREESIVSDAESDRVRELGDEGHPLYDKDIAGGYAAER